MNNTISPSLAGKRGLVFGIANESSIAAGCAAAFIAAGAEVAATYPNEKSLRFITPVTEALGINLLLPCDVSHEGEMAAVFEKLKTEWGKLDFLLHAIAFAPADDLHGRVIDSSADGFALAMDISCHSFLRMAHFAEPLMSEGGSLLTVTYYGSARVVEHYALMGPVKAALESAVRYAAAELGPKFIRANAISPGAMKTRAGSGLAHFDDLLAAEAGRAPEHQLATQADVGALAAFLVGDGAKRITGTVIPVDGGMSAIA